MHARGELNGLRVLVVEDEVLVAQTMETILAELGCTVVGPAPGLREALELARHDVDCAVLDIKLGEDDVFPLADKLKLMGVPYIFYSGLGQTALRSRDGTYQLLEKPIDRRALERALRAAGGSRRYETRR
jgi:CheY-like chemotaxis protein